MLEIIKNWLIKRIWMLGIGLVIWLGVSWLWNKRTIEMARAKAEKKATGGFYFGITNKTIEDFKTEWKDEKSRIDRIPDDSLQYEIDRLYNNPK